MSKEGQSERTRRRCIKGSWALNFPVPPPRRGKKYGKVGLAHEGKASEGSAGEIGKTQANLNPLRAGGGFYTIWPSRREGPLPDMIREK